jgi:hypothetical protein
VTIVEDAPWGALFCAGFSAACVWFAVGVQRARADPPVLFMFDDEELTVFPLPGDRIFARFMPSRVGSVRWTDLAQVTTIGVRKGMGLAFIRRGERRLLLAQPGWTGMSAHAFLLESRRRAEAAGARVTWPPDEALEARLPTSSSPGRRRRGGFPHAEVRRAPDGSIEIGFARRDVLLLCVIAVAVCGLGATGSVFNEMLPFTPRAALLSWIVLSCLSVAGLLALFWSPAILAAPAGLGVRGRPRGPMPWRELREVRWSELGRALTISLVDGRIRTSDLSPFAGPIARAGIREVLRVCERNGVPTVIVDEVP